MYKPKFRIWDRTAVKYQEIEELRSWVEKIRQGLGGFPQREKKEYR